MERRKFTRERLMLFKDLGAGAATRAAASVERIIGNQFDVSEINSGLIRMETLMEDSGDLEQEAVGIYTRVQGHAPGFAVFLFPKNQAPELVYAMVGYESQGMALYDTTPALEELGDIVISCLLDEISNRSGLTMWLTTANVTVDMAGAIMSSLVSTGLETTDRALTVAFRFGKGPGFMDGLLLYVPDPGSMEMIEDSCKAHKGMNPALEVSGLSWSDIQTLREEVTDPMWKSGGSTGVYKQ